MASDKSQTVSSRPFLIRLAATLIFAVAAHAGAQRQDVPYVPTPPNVVDAMLQLAGVGPADYLIDLGSGDGRIVIAAAKKYGARGLGVEIEGSLVSDSRREAQRQGVSDRAEFQERNLFITDLSRATVVTMYLFPQVIMQLRPRLLAELKPGTRVVSHEFDMDNWLPDERMKIAVPDKPYGPPFSEIYLWIVPANVAGGWRWQLDVGGWPVAYEIVLQQTFQMLAGDPVVEGKPARIESGRMRGEEIRFMLTAELGGRTLRHEFTGRASGDAISGKVRLDGGGEVGWNAVRVKSGSIGVPGDE
jgi:Histone methylation protein DOT1